MSLLQVGNKSEISWRYAFGTVQSQDGKVPANYERMVCIMKRNIKFFTIVISLLLLSSIILTGCMYAIAADYGKMKPYDLNGQKENSNSSGGNIVENEPTSQDSLQAKFEAMYEIGEDGKTITVISEDYLNKYWQSNYEKEVIKSLSTEEVYFIIQDSIRIYEEYDEVVLTGFASLSSAIQAAERFPFVKDKIITTKPMNTQYYHEEDMLCIYSIIMYRLTALSSPKAFFTGAEAIRFNGGDPNLYSSMYPETMFYIPGYSETTDRDYILSACGGNADFVDHKRFCDLFVVSAWGEPVIEFSSITNGSTTQVYPTVEMENKYSGFYTTTPGGYEYDNNGKLPVEIVYGPSFSLNRNHGFTMSLHSSMSSAIGGMYMRMDNKLTLICGYGDANYTFVFYYQECEGYRYAKSESAPPSGYDFEDGTMFYFDLRDGITGKPNDPDKPIDPPNGTGGNPTDVHAEDFERYYPDELFNLYSLSEIVSWDDIYAAEKMLLTNNPNFYNEQLPPLYLMIKELAVSKEDFVKVADDISEEQIEWLFATDEAAVMKHLKADWVFYYEGRLYNVFELAELDKDLIIELRECGALNEFIAYMESLDVEFEALDLIKNAGE